MSYALRAIEIGLHVAHLALRALVLLHAPDHSRPLPSESLTGQLADLSLTFRVLALHSVGLAHRAPPRGQWLELLVCGLAGSSTVESRAEKERLFQLRLVNG